MSNLPVLFISHAHSDKELAAIVQRFIRKVFGGKAFDIFVSSDKESLQLGDDWRRKIIEKLKEASVVIVILTPVSEEKVWVSFEAGGAVCLDKKVITLIASGAQNVPSTLEHLQGGLELDQMATLQRLAEELDHIVNHSPDSDTIDVMAKSSAAEIQAIVQRQPAFQNTETASTKVSTPIAVAGTPEFGNLDSSKALKGSLLLALDNPIISPRELIESLSPEFLTEEDLFEILEKLTGIMRKHGKSPNRLSP